MSDIYNLLNNAANEKVEEKPRIPPEEYAKQKQQKRQNLYDMAEKQIHEVVSSPQNYLNYLEMQSKFGYTVTNTLLVMAQCPQATLLKDNNRWVEEKKYVKKGVKGIGILEPKGEYQGNDGVIRTNYDVKYVFDISQLNRPYRMKKQNLSVREIISGLVYQSPVKMQMVDNTENGSLVQYSPDNQMIYYADGMRPTDLMEGLAREYCYVEFESQYGNVDRTEDAFMVKSAAYILCKKLNIPVSNVDFANEVKNYFEGMDSRDTKEELSNIKSIADEVSNRAERGIYRLQQERDSVSRGEER